MDKYRMLIGGEWIEGDSSFVVRNPYDNSEIAEISAASPQHLKEAVNKAHLAFQKTRRMNSAERSTVLGKIVIGIGERMEEIARAISLESGKTIRDARTEVARSMNTFTVAAEEAKRFGGELIPLDLLPATKGRWGLTRRFPIGPILAISPFNFPLNLVAHKVAPAIAVGNPFIIKPSSATPVTALKLAEIIVKAGWCPEAVSVTPCKGAVTESILDDPRLKKLSFTGSPEVGWRLKSLCGKMKITLELGGNAAAIIDDPDSIDYAVNRCVLGAFSNAGQICISIQRIIIRQDLYDRFTSAFVEKASALKMGDQLEDETDLGPMIDLHSAEKAEIWVNQALDNGAKRLLGGERKGTMFPPTILTEVPRSQPVYCNEIFAPVVILSQYADFDDALAEVNDSKYGLQAGVFTSDLKKAWQAFETLEVGGVMIGDIPTFRIDHMPYGGVKESGFGREGLRYAMEEMTEMRLLTINPVS